MITVGIIKIGLNNKPVVIAEMSGNNNQSLNRALKIVDVAANCGVQMIKLLLSIFTYMIIVPLFGCNNTENKTQEIDNKSYINNFEIT